MQEDSFFRLNCYEMLKQFALGRLKTTQRAAPQLLAKVPGVRVHRKNNSYVDEK